MNFQKVSPGQEIVFRANEWNAMLGAGAAWLNGLLTVNAKVGRRREGIIQVKNGTANAIPPYRALALDEPLLGQDVDAFQDEFAFNGVTPDPENEPTHRSRVAILLAPAAAGDIVPALIRGQIVLPIRVYDVAHNRARVIADGTLQSCTFGPIRILGVQETGENKLCLCDVDGFDGGHTLIKVPSGGITGGTYAAPEETLCRIAWPHADTGAATDHPSETDHRVNVFNYGPEIAHSEGKYIHARIMAGRIIPDVEYCSED